MDNFGVLAICRFLFGVTFNIYIYIYIYIIILMAVWIIRCRLYSWGDSVAFKKYLICSMPFDRRPCHSIFSCRESSQTHPRTTSLFKKLVLEIFIMQREGAFKSKHILFRFLIGTVLEKDTCLFNVLQIPTQCLANFHAWQHYANFQYNVCHAGIKTSQRKSSEMRN